MLEPGRVSKEYLQSLFCNKTKKEEKKVYPCNPKFNYTKVGFNGYTFHGHVILMNIKDGIYYCKL